jgi:Tfp pilus assembly protein PilO
LTIGLAVRFGMDWAATSGSSTDALTGKQIQLKALDIETTPLRGLDKKVVVSRAQIQEFLQKRIPANYSSISTRIGELGVKTGVRITRLQYTPGAPGSDLTEISLDAGISGEYSQIMHFANDLERDETFFVIRGMQLTSQQGGKVNLHLRVSTWLRPGDVPQAAPAETAPASAEVPAKEGD